MTKTYIEEMKREQVINELRKHAHPQWFHSLLAWSTPFLKALLTYYTTSEKKEYTLPKGASRHTSSEGAALGCYSCTLIEKMRARKIVGLEIRVTKTAIA